MSYVLCACVQLRLVSTDGPLPHSLSPLVRALAPRVAGSAGSTGTANAGAASESRADAPLLANLSMLYGVSSLGFFNFFNFSTSLAFGRCIFVLIFLLSAISRVCKF